MIKKLTRHGNSLALVIDRAVLDLLEIKADTSFRILTDRRTLIISPAPEQEHRRKIKAASATANERYGRMLKRLAR